MREYCERTAGACVDSRMQLRIYCRDAAALHDELGPESVDYILTDPPYGGHIAYLDLSVLWNHWLGFTVPDASAEAIVGGEMRLTEEHYKIKLADSVGRCLEMLRKNRWITVVFQHWDVSYFEAILDAAANGGGSLKAAITHDKDVIWSMHKKRNSESVLGGEMLLTFHKARKPLPRPPVLEQTASLDKLLDESLAKLPAGAFRTEALFNRLTIAAWEQNSISTLAIDSGGMAKRLVLRGWHYDAGRHVWSREIATNAELSLSS